MNEEMFTRFLDGSVLLCLILGVLSPALRWKRHGPAAIPLGLAFFVMAALLYGLSNAWPQSRIIAVAVVLVILLAGDALLRSNTELKK